MPEREHTVELPADPATCLRLLERTAEAWDAGWQAWGSGGRLGLPVTAGLRHGWVAGRVEVEATAGGSRLRFRVDQSEYRLETAAVLTLILAACGAAVTIVAPFFPRLLPLMPLGILLALGAWFFIVARLRNSGPEEFFRDLAEQTRTEERPAPG